MTIHLTDLLEEAIVGRLVMTLAEDGYRLQISDVDGGGLHVYAVPDGGDKPKDGYDHWIKLVPGNGCDVISDYTTNLEKVIEPALAFAELFR